MIVLLPHLAIGAALSALVCVNAGYTGALMALMLIVFWAVFYLCSLVVYVGILGVISLFIDPNRQEKSLSPFYTGLTKYTMGLVPALLRTRIHLTGEDKIPEGRWLLVCNHRSAFDPLLTIWALRKYDLAFVAKPSIFSVPIFGRFAHRCCFLAINREDDREALKTILRAADLIKSDVTSFCIYPEGTRNRGSGLLPFRNGAFKIAQRAKVPVVVMTLEGTDKIKKNFPLKRTDVNMRICGVISAEQVLSMKTPDIGEEVRRCMECESV